MRYLGGHLGTAVSALLDGQLDRASTERAWSHVQGCALCVRQLEHEGWVKRRLATISGVGDGPPAQLLGSLYGLPHGIDRGGAGQDPWSTVSTGSTGWGDADAEVAAWAAVGEIERRGRGRRRTGLALAGAGSVSVAVLGFASLGGATLGISGTPAETTPTSLTRSGVPTATVAPASSATQSGPSVVPTGFLTPSSRGHGWLPLLVYDEQLGQDTGVGADLQR